jgi:hypothetical protein
MEIRMLNNCCKTEYPSLNITKRNEAKKWTLLKQFALLYIQSFGTIGQLLKSPPLSAQKCQSAGHRGGPEFFFDRNPTVFVT